MGRSGWFSNPDKILLARVLDLYFSNGHYYGCARSNIFSKKLWTLIHIIEGNQCVPIFFSN